MDCFSHGFLWLKLSVSSSMLFVTYAQTSADSLKTVTKPNRHANHPLYTAGDIDSGFRQKNSVPKPLTLSLLFRGFFQFFL